MSVEESLPREQQLLPCPACGSGLLQMRSRREGRRQRFFLRCGTCGESGPGRSSVENATRAWNAPLVVRIVSERSEV